MLNNGGAVQTILNPLHLQIDKNLFMNKEECCMKKKCGACCFPF